MLLFLSVMLTSSFGSPRPYWPRLAAFSSTKRSELSDESVDNMLEIAESSMPMDLGEVICHLPLLSFAITI